MREVFFYTIKGNLSYVAKDNRLQSFEDVGFLSDDDGNLTGASLGGNMSLTINGLNAQNGEMSLNYDSRNRLVLGTIEATGQLTGDYAGVPANANLVQGYGYDAEDYRVYSSYRAEIISVSSTP